MNFAKSALAAWVEPEKILLDEDLRDRSDALACIATAAALRHDLDAAPVLRALARREQAGSTGVGDGFAIPHARIEGLQRPLTLFVRARQSIEFAAPDGRLVRDFFAVLVPADGHRQEHLDLLAIVATLFSDRGFRQGLDSAQGVECAARQFRIAIAQLSMRNRIDSH